jgi:hypothetical protein
MRTDMSSEAEYTSVSVALSHTVAELPNPRPAANAAGTSRVHRVTRIAASPPATAVHAAASRFVATAVGRRSSSNLQARPTRMNSGVPGGCGIPSDSIADANSPASHSVTLGARLAR